MAKKNNPFQKPQADSKGSAEAQDAGQVSAAALEGQVPVEAPAAAEPATPEPLVQEQPLEDQPPIEAEVAPVDFSKFTKEQAKAYIAEQFKAGNKVEVIALQDGEHPKPGQWKRAGEKFQLKFPEAYSHRWMKLA